MRKVGNYIFGVHISSGKFGIVSQCYDNDDNKYAVKQVEQFQQERILSFDHPNVLKIKQILYEDQKQYIVMPLYQQNLSQFRNTFPQQYFKQIFTSIGEGLAYLHSNNITHGDLKLNNIFYKRSGGKLKVVIGDFSKVNFESQQSDFKYDVHLFVMMIWEWLTRTDLRNKQRHTVVSFKTFKKYYKKEMIEFLSQDLQKFIIKIIPPDELLYLNIKQILNLIKLLPNPKPGIYKATKTKIICKKKQLYKKILLSECQSEQIQQNIQIGQNKDFKEIAKNQKRFQQMLVSLRKKYPIKTKDQLYSKQMAYWQQMIWNNLRNKYQEDSNKGIILLIGAQYLIDRQSLGKALKISPEEVQNIIYQLMQEGLKVSQLYPYFIFDKFI